MSQLKLVKFRSPFSPPFQVFLDAFEVTSPKIYTVLSKLKFVFAMYGSIPIVRHYFFPIVLVMYGSIPIGRHYFFLSVGTKVYNLTQQLLFLLLWLLVDPAAGCLVSTNTMKVFPSCPGREEWGVCRHRQGGTTLQAAAGGVRLLAARFKT